jgi:hypothetical protein
MAAKRRSNKKMIQKPFFKLAGKAEEVMVNIKIKMRLRVPDA